MDRSEEHTSELQSLRHLVCSLLLECSGAPRDLHSFPTRRSSDLAGVLVSGAGWAPPPVGVPQAASAPVTPSPSRPPARPKSPLRLVCTFVLPSTCRTSARFLDG